MKSVTNPVFCFLLLPALILLYSSPVYAKERCKPLLIKLHNIQKMQRNGYSLKRGQSLRAKGDKARDKWWQCEHTSLARFKAQNGKVKKKSAKFARNNIKKKSNYKRSSRYSSPKKTTFNQTSAIVIKSKYQGGKNLAWLDFYQKPVRCNRPKSLTAFAYCSENKLEQQTQFEKQYSQ